MKKVLNYLLGYILWAAVIGLALYLFVLLRTAFLSILTLFLNPANLSHAQRMNVYDRIFVILIGLGWLILMIFTEQHFRIGAAKGELLKRFAEVTGPLLLTIFVVDLILLWFKGGITMLQWLTLLVELGGGIGLVVLAKTRLAPTSN